MVPKLKKNTFYHEANSILSESWHFTSQFTQGDKSTEFLKMFMLPLYFYNSPIFFLGGGYQGFNLI